LRGIKFKQHRVNEGFFENVRANNIK